MEMTKATIPMQPTGLEYESMFELLDRVRRRAYELYEGRGKVDGHDLEDWLQAESEVIKTVKRAEAA